MKIGDKVKIIKCDGDPFCSLVGRVATIRSRYCGGWRLTGINDGHWWREGEEIILVGENTMTTRRTFRLLKNTPWVAKGALFQEACDDGDQEYRLLDDEFLVEADWYNHFEDTVGLSRDQVEKQPEWFEEVEMTWVAKVTRSVKKVVKKGKK